jgi:hypothetical protein
MKKNSKKLIVFVAVMMLTLSFASSGFAANTMSNLKAYYKNITVYKNGGLFNFSSEPFIVDGTTYVPLRDMAEMLDKEVTWDGVGYKIGVNDKPGQSTVELTQQVFNQQLTISQLEGKIKNLESQLEKEEKEKKATSLKDLSKDLLDDYDQINKNISVTDISITGDKDDVDVEVTINLKDTKSGDAWDKLVDEDMGKIEKYLQKIVDAILDIEKYEDADVTGVIYDKYEKEDLIEFEIDKKGNVEAYEL